MQINTCVGCGCRDDRACDTRPPCHWVFFNVRYSLGWCSVCEEARQDALRLRNQASGSGYVAELDVPPEVEAAVLELAQTTLSTADTMYRTGRLLSAIGSWTNRLRNTLFVDRDNLQRLAANMKNDLLTNAGWTRARQIEYRRAMKERL
jgi:hypothetical protein